MPDKKQDDETKNTDDKVERFINEIKKENPDLSDEDVEELKKMLLMIGNKRKQNKFKRALYFVKNAFIKFVIYYFLSTVLLGLFFNTLTLENKYYVFLVSLVVSTILLLFNIIPKGFSKKDFYYSIFAFILVFINLWLLNRVYPVFENFIYCIIYIILIEIITAFITYRLFLRKFKR